MFVVCSNLGLNCAQLSKRHNNYDQDGGWPVCNDIIII